MAKLSDICNIQSGGTPSRSCGEYWENGNIPWVKISDIKGKNLTCTEEKITELGLEKSSAKLFKKGTILYSIFATLGEVAILDIDATTNQAIAGLQLFDNNVLPDYMYYYLVSKKDFVNYIGRGGAQNNINLKILRDMEINIPTKEEQKSVILQLNKLNDCIALRKEQIAKLDELVKSRFIEMFGDLKSNPLGWERKNFSELAEIITDGEHSTPRRVEKGIYLLSARNILNHSLQLDDVDYIDEDEYIRISKRIIPQKGDVLISCSGTVGRCCSVPEGFRFQMVRSVAIVRFKNMIQPIFAEYMITSDYLQEQINGSKTMSSQANLFQGKIAKLKGFIPPIDLQNEFAMFVEQIDKLKIETKKSLEKLETLKKALMQKYFG